MVEKNAVPPFWCLRAPGFCLRSLRRRAFALSRCGVALASFFCGGGEAPFKDKDNPPQKEKTQATFPKTQAHCGGCYSACPLLVACRKLSCRNGPSFLLCLERTSKNSTLSLGRTALKQNNRFSINMPQHKHLFVNHVRLCCPPPIV